MDFLPSHSAAATSSGELLIQTTNFFDLWDLSPEVPLGDGQHGPVLPCELRRRGGRLSPPPLLPAFASANPNANYVVKVARDTPRLRDALAIHAAATPHPNIVPLVAVYANELPADSLILRRNRKLKPGDHLLMVMPRAAGGDLLTHIMYSLHRPLTEDEGRVVIYQCILSLAHLHSLGLVHGDVKLENFVVGSTAASTCTSPSSSSPQGALLPLPFDLHVQLIDFDAQFARRAKDMPTTSFTKAYVAPEIVHNVERSEAQQAPVWFGTTADVWAMGCTAFMMLTGQVPFKCLETEPEHTNPRWLTPHLRACVRIGAFPVAHLGALSRPALDLLHRMLDPNPHTRITAAQLLHHPFFHSLSFRLLPDSGMEEEDEDEIVWNAVGGSEGGVLMSGDGACEVGMMVVDAVLDDVDEAVAAVVVGGRGGNGGGDGSPAAAAAVGVVPAVVSAGPAPLGEQGHVVTVITSDDGDDDGGGGAEADAAVPM